MKKHIISPIFSIANNLCLAMLFLTLCSCKTDGEKEVKIDTPPVRTDTLGKVIDPANPITMDEFIGANSFVDDPIDKAKAVGFLREYHNWGWDEGNWDAYPGYPNNKIAWAPSAPGWSFDDYYASVVKAGLKVSPCIQGATAWLNASNNFKSNDKPVDAPGLSSRDPQSYHAKAHHLFQFVARYGSKKVDVQKLTLANGQPTKSGLNLIKYIEDWNEQDKSWEGPNAEFSPEEYAAMASADYDGHCNTLTGGKGTFGAKNADPDIKYVMGGLVEMNLDYVKRMKTWFEANRKDKRFACDVINFHVYAWKDGNSWQGGGPAISPEAARFKEKAAQIVSYRNQNLPGVEVWISEFGWDTNPQSPLSVPKIGTYDLQEIQGFWLVRAYLAFAAAGIDRAQMFVLRDGDPNDPTWFASSGLIGKKGDFSPKKSWYYVATLKNTLKDMRFIGEQKTDNPDLLVYKFKDIRSNKGVYAVWFKTSVNKTADNVPISLSSTATKAELIEMLAGSTDGEDQPTTIKDGKVYISVSEKPVFIRVDNIEAKDGL
ncbi:MAG: hypothetical protein QM727_12920 [Niabella sp.]